MQFKMGPPGPSSPRGVLISAETLIAVDAVVAGIDDGIGETVLDKDKIVKRRAVILKIIRVQKL